MADNIELDPGTGGAVVKTDEDGSSNHWQYTKTAFGADGTQTRVTSSVGLPVDLISVTPDLMLGTDFSAVMGTVSLITLAQADDLSNSLDALRTTTFNYVYDGSTWDRLKGDSTNGMLVNLGSNNDVGINTVGSVIDANNSSTSTLLLDAVFTGTGTDLLGYSAVCVTIDASHDSATDGMTFQFSTNDADWDDIYTFTYTAADGARRFQFPVTARYFRVVYTNGGTNQTHFRCQTILHTATQLTSIHRMVDVLDPDRSALVAKSIVLAQAAGSGDFVPVQATAAGNFKVAVEEISDGLDIGAGNAGTETARVSISTDDVNLSAIKTAVETAIAATTDTIAAALMTNVLHNGTTALTPKFASFSSASSGNQALIAAVAAKTTRILALQLQPSASTNAIYINDGTANLYGDATNKIQFDDTGAAGLGGFTLPFNPLGWFETAAVNRPININLGSANGVIGVAVYVEV